MPKVALEGTKTNRSVANDHIYYRRWAYQYTDPVSGNDVYDWNYYYTHANIDGECKSSVSNVRIQGKSPVVQGDTTVERDSYTLPSNSEYLSGNHTSATGSITSGNSNRVYINGKLVSVQGSNVRTHANTNTNISNNGVSTTVNVGG